MEAAQTALEKKREELKPQIAARLARQAQRELDISRNLLLQRQNYLENYERALVEEQEQLEKQKANTNVNQVDLEMFKENYVPLEEVVKRLSVEAQMTGVELEAPPRVEPLQPAVVDLDWAQKRAKQVTALAGLVGLALGMGLVTLWEARARRLSGDQEVLQGLGFPIVGLVPRIPRLGDNYSHLKGQAPTGAIVAFTEHMDITRTRFLHLTRLGNAQVIMVASAGPGEGKTMVCCHLAASLVGAGRKTVLVDGDMRRPSVHRVLGLPDSPGLAEVLRGETALGNALFSTPIANLWVIPAGRGTGKRLRPWPREILPNYLGISGIISTSPWWTRPRYSLLPIPCCLVNIAMESFFRPWRGSAKLSLYRPPPTAFRNWTSGCLGPLSTGPTLTGPTDITMRSHVLDLLAVVWQERKGCEVSPGRLP